jgi:N utilization substance protein B
VAVGRRSARRQAVFALYRQDLLKLTSEAALRRVPSADPDPYAVGLLNGTTEQLDVIDALLGQHLADWSLERLGVLERSILRVASYELLFEASVPEAVVIDEAVGLAKRYCSVEAGALVNGVLGSMAADSKRETHCDDEEQEGS